MNLAPGTALERYEIVRPVGQGGFGITYLAEHARLHTTVIIKEFFPNQLVWRSQDGVHVEARPEFSAEAKHFLDSFEKEAQLLATFSHQNIVRVTDVFEANDTAYIVMAYEQGETLEDAFRDGRLRDEPALRGLLGPLLDALDVLHEKGVIHRDIKGDNIIVREDGSPVLIDFGSARVAHGVATQTVTALVTPGYAPIEQFDADSARLGPWTDIYALGATLYRAIAGKPPTRAFERSSTIADQRPDPFTALTSESQPNYAPPFLAAVNAALAFSPQNRPQTTRQWRELLETGAVTSASDAATQPAPRPPATTGARGPAAASAAPTASAHGTAAAVTSDGPEAEVDAQAPTVISAAVAAAEAGAAAAGAPAKPDHGGQQAAPAAANADLPSVSAGSTTSELGEPRSGTGRTVLVAAAGGALVAAIAAGLWFWQADRPDAAGGGVAGFKPKVVVVAANDPQPPGAVVAASDPASEDATPPVAGVAQPADPVLAIAASQPPALPAASPPATATPSISIQADALVSARPGAADAAGASAIDSSRAAPDGTAAATELRALLARWVSAWERNTVSVDEYAGFYAGDFEAKGMDRTAWLADKRDKGQRAECIDVDVDAPRITLSGDRAVVEFVQTYRSHRYCDVGTKTMVLERVAGEWRVVSEDQPTYARCNDFCTARS